MLQHISNEANKVEAHGASDDQPTKDDLLNRAKVEIDKSEGKVRLAAEALAQAKKEFGATQKEMAKAIDRSQSYVAKLLKWCDSGFKENSPFGPTTKAEREAQYSHGNKKTGEQTGSDTDDDNLEKIRLAHAERMGRNGNGGVAANDNENDPDALIDAKLRNPMDEDAEAITRAVSAAEALAKLKEAIDRFAPLLDATGRSHAQAYLSHKVKSPS